MFWTGSEVLALGYTLLFVCTYADGTVLQIGLSVLASLPDTNDVFPLLGRPQDSLNEDEKQQVSLSRASCLQHPNYV
jgi:hypothetical protein